MYRLGGLARQRDFWQSRKECTEFTVHVYMHSLSFRKQTKTTRTGGFCLLSALGVRRLVRDVFPYLVGGLCLSCVPSFFGQILFQRA